MTQILIPIKQYAKTAAQLASDNYIHIDRQLVIAKDTGVIKLGDGVTAYNSLLPLFSSGGGEWGSITGTLSDQGDLQSALSARLLLTGGTITGSLSVGSTTSAIGKLSIFAAPSASSNFGLINIGDAPFNGASSGFFTGNANGTAIALNFTSAFRGNAIDIQYNTASANDSALHYKAQNKTNTNVFSMQTVNGGTYINNTNGNGTGSFGIFANFAWMQKRLHIGTNYYTPLSALLLSDAPSASSNYGLISAGNAAFDGATSGFFTGNANGTVIATNISGSADMINLQKLGVCKFKIDNNGAISIASMADGTAPNGSLYFSTTANKLVWKNSAGTVNNLY